ncbi:hypothetical protein INR49_003275 [Caranx melampygus]|nr:hypothetical protein INR49_003275 [Caranx melampygus]
MQAIGGYRRQLCGPPLSCEKAAGCGCAEEGRLPAAQLRPASSEDQLHQSRISLICVLMQS